MNDRWYAVGAILIVIGILWFSIGLGIIAAGVVMILATAFNQWSSDVEYDAEDEGEAGESI